MTISANWGSFFPGTWLFHPPADSGSKTWSRKLGRDCDVYVAAAVCFAIIHPGFLLIIQIEKNLCWAHAFVP